MRFWLGTHEPSWLSRQDVNVPLFLSHRRLGRLRSYRPATVPWALDSGGFTELDKYGRWVTTPGDYALAVKRYADEIGRLQWVAPQDWMCEPFMLRNTGLTVAEHQDRTIRSVVELRSMIDDVPVIPVLQGWTRGDYMAHAEMYEAKGFDLEEEPLVGLGSVCRRQATGQVESIVMDLHPIRLHGFGVKGEAIGRYGSLLASADSMAWSYAGRRDPDPACPKAACSNCLHYALDWRARALHPLRPSLWGHSDG